VLIDRLAHELERTRTPGGIDDCEERRLGATEGVASGCGVGWRQRRRPPAWRWRVRLEVDHEVRAARADPSGVADRDIVDPGAVEPGATVAAEIAEATLAPVPRHGKVLRGELRVERDGEGDEVAPANG